MNNLIFGIYFSFRILLMLLAAIVFGFIFWKEDWVFSQIVIGSFIVLMSIELNHFVRKTEREVRRLFEILQFDDYSRTLSTKRFPSALMEAMQKLKSHHQLNHQALQHKEQLTFKALDFLTTGICVVQDGNKITMQNSHFKTLLNISTISNLEQLFQQLPGLEKQLKNIREEDTMLLQPEENDYRFNSALRLQVKAQKIEKSEYLILLLSGENQKNTSLDFDAWFNFGKVITHEINNGISPILSLTESILHLLSKDSSHTQITKIEEASSIIIEQCNSLLAFSEKYQQLIKIPTPQLQEVDLQAIIQQVFETFRQQLENIQVSLSFDEGMALIQGDADQLKQVFSNLLLNSIHAMENSELKKVAVVVARKKENYMVQFSDNGVGIPEELKASVFIPFFSTRENGNGIGLSLARQMLWKHGASIHIGSVTIGSSFTLVFPKRAMN